MKFTGRLRLGGRYALLGALVSKWVEERGLGVQDQMIIDLRYDKGKSYKFIGDVVGRNGQWVRRRVKWYEEVSMLNK